MARGNVHLQYAAFLHLRRYLLINCTGLTIAMVMDALSLLVAVLGLRVRLPSNTSGPVSNALLKEGCV